jgi:hypothetical protein
MWRHLHALALGVVLIGCGPSGPAATSPGAATPGSSIGSPVVREPEDHSLTPASTPSDAPATVPSTTPAPSPLATRCPAGSLAAVPGTLVRPRVDALAEVVTDDLRVRSEPGLEAGSKVLHRKLMRRDVAYVVAGPVSASCYDWYQVYVPYDPAHDRDEAFGWVAAAATDGEPWLVGGQKICPDRPRSVSDLAGLPITVGLACFAGKRLTFDAWLGAYETCGMSEGWTVKPRWLGDPCAGNDGMWIADRRIHDASDFGANEPVTAVFAPKVDTSRLHPGNPPKTWIPVRVTGIFDHPAAQTCHGVADWAEVPITDGQAVLQCRAEFVITSITRQR